MSTQAGFALRGRNPDVLTCIANLSSDEVFTPPEFANRMLDTLAEAWAADHNGANLWADKTVKFLDPFTKSGVFLREITSRLTKGLAAEISDLEERVDHILTKQVFGIGITHLTGLLARRSVYCSNQLQALCRQVVHNREWQHLVRAHGAHMGGWQVQVLRGKPKDVRTRRRP
jgi:site-specific DNA-methyltransferase (adenine-specific)